eukprot:3179733-Rhodomonas_salina.2
MGFRSPCAPRFFPMISDPACSPVSPPHNPRPPIARLCASGEFLAKEHARMGQCVRANAPQESGDAGELQGSAGHRVGKERDAAPRRNRSVTGARTF